MQHHFADPERQRLAESRRKKIDWRRWGPYLSERQWGTVREDYSPHGDAWAYFSHDQARSRAYRWGEDGIAGFSDADQLLCLSVALWNERDPILKERLFGLTNQQGNHGEDVKEVYYYLDATPTHSYLKMLYKYPQRAFPYDQLVAENARRGKHDAEFELIDTGVFDDDRYFDVFVEYAKAGVDDILLRVTVHNRGPEDARIHVLPHLWFRNTWSWTGVVRKPELSIAADGALEARHPLLGNYLLYAEGSPRLLFCENETNLPLLYNVNGVKSYYKDGINDFVVNGDEKAIHPDQIGTRAAAHHVLTIAPGASHVLCFRLVDKAMREPFADFTATFEQRRKEADQFYAVLQEEIPDADHRAIQRQALAGMIWSKQLYHYDIPLWLSGDMAQPKPPRERRHGRNHDWPHVNNSEILSMPDKWEYPWFAAWDLAFHCLPLALVDAEFAKEQLILLTREWYMHPNGQLPAYEWNFSDVNPPVHAWATWRVFQMDRKQQGGTGDLAFLERVFHKLMLNFTWWVNRKDAQGRNVFQGGFLGLDNIGVFDRSAKLPGDITLTQADATAWMSMYCLNLMRIALELARHNPVYEDIATKFFEHFLTIAKAMTSIGADGADDEGASAPGVSLWDDEDKFYYDELSLGDGQMHKLKVRSMVGLIPLFAVEVLEPELLQQLPDFNRRLQWFLNNRPDLAQLVSRWHEPGRGERRLLSLLRGHRMKRLLKRMLDETEFLSEYGVRSLSKVYQDQPYVLSCMGSEFAVQYVPGDSDSGMFGGNSNWRGPIWFPVNYLLIESLQKFHHYYGADFTVECPTGSGKFLTLLEISQELEHRLIRLFERDATGHRPCLGSHPKVQGDPHFRDYLPFYEFFHGDTGHGLGASHQTGWTGLIAKLLQPRREVIHHEEDDDRPPPPKPSQVLVPIV